MPVYFSIEKNGEPYKPPKGYGLWHKQVCETMIDVEGHLLDGRPSHDTLQTMMVEGWGERWSYLEAAREIWQGLSGLKSSSLQTTGWYEFRMEHSFYDPSDGETLDIFPGDRFNCYWSHF